MADVKRSPLLRYGVAILLVAVASVITWFLQAEHTRTPFAFYFIAVIAATIYGGRWPGLMAITLSAIISSYLILPPRFSFLIGAEGVIQLGVFLFVALVISSLAERASAAEQRTRLSEANLRTTLQSIGDAVISTDSRGRVTFMNPVAQALTGWSMEEAEGRELSEVFRIINEYSRQAVENPIEKVLRDGGVVGLANHTLLVARDGREIPIDDSGAPIKDEEGKITGVVLVFHDITARRRGEEALRESEERFAKAFESSPLALTITSLKTGRLLEVNETFTQLTGYTRDEAVGRTTLELGLWASPPDREAELGMIAEAGKVHNTQYRFRMRDGRELIGLLSAERIDIGGEPCVLTVIQDITEQKRIEEERERLFHLERQARTEAEEANRLKDEFLATLSHELRTPLTAMLGWTRMLRTRMLDERTSRQALETIERNVRSQTQLIEDLLDVSRIITGNLRLDARPVEPASVIEAAIDSIQPAAEAKEIELERAIDPTASPVLGDPARLQQVVWNLLSNAVKFTPKGGRVLISVERVESYAAISVTDTGIGISREFLPHVFDRFRQADSSSTRSHGGLGLGLAIVRHLVELHGGTIEARSKGVQRGASFTVKLPLMVVNIRSDDAVEAGGDGAQAGNIAVLECPPLLKGVRILVVDDEEDARQLLSTILLQCEALVETASNAAQAMQAIRKRRPDVLISDIGMPDEDGYGLLEKVRAESDPKVKELPAVALTGYAGEQDRTRSMAAGFQLHLTKPIDPQALIAAVSRLVNKE